MKAVYNNMNVIAYLCKNCSNYKEYEIFFIHFYFDIFLQVI
jgi:hypothetical protein